MNNRRLLCSLIVLASCLSARRCSAQLVYDGNNNIPPFGSFAGSDFDLVSLQTGNLHIHIPIGSWPQRGGQTLTAAYIYDAPSWTWKTTTQIVNKQKWYFTTITPTGGGFRLSTNWGYWSVQSSIDTYTCNGSPTNWYHNWVVTDPEGTKHPVPGIDFSVTGCIGGTKIAPTMDDSGMMVDIGRTPPVLSLKDGTQIDLTKSTDYSYFATTVEDANGNLTGSTADTLNRNLITVTNNSGYDLLTVTDSNGIPQNYRIDYISIPGHTHFCPTHYTYSSCGELSGNRSLPQKLTLPSGATYQFTWVSNSLYQLQSVTLPTGATITYGAGQGPAPGCSSPPQYVGAPYDATTVPHDCHAAFGQRTLTMNGANYLWNYAWNLNNTGTGVATVTDPNLNDQVHSWNFVTVNGVTSPNTVETDVTWYQGLSTSGGTVLKKTHTDYTGEEYPAFAAPLLGNIRPIRVTTTLDNGFVTKTETDYETNQYHCTETLGCPLTFTRMDPLEIREYAYANGTPGPLLRRTHYTYLDDSNASYVTSPLYIADRKASEIVYDGSNTASQTTYEYDVYNHGSLPSMGASGAVQHDAARNTNYLTRGNQTGVSRWLNVGSTWLTTNNQYDDAGSIIATKDPKGNVTSLDYTDSWTSIPGTSGGTACAPSGGQGKAYLTKVTNPLGQMTTHTYYSCTGALGSTTDPNSLTTWNVYDLFGRNVLRHKPDGGVTATCFTDTGGTGCQQAGPPFQAKTTTSINSSINKITTEVYDGLGRITQTQLNSDPQGPVYTDTTYDGLGRVATVSNPYRSGTDLTTSSGTTAYAYDALGRKISETYSADGSVLKTAYCNSTTLVTDPTKRWRRSSTDALGRLVEVDEPNSSTATVSPCQGAGEPIWITTYNYNVMGDLMGVVQNLSRQRNFTYDSLSRLWTSTNPETGTITYTYDANGNVQTKKDARNITTTYSYDALNRELTRAYSNNDPTISTYYDEPGCRGLSACQNIGYRTRMTDGSGSEGWAYYIDTANSRRINIDQRTTNSLTKSSTYYLDLAGNVTQLNYPTGRIVNYFFDTANRPVKAQDSANNITYATGFQASPGSSCIANVTCYTPQGTVYAVSLGQTSTFTGLKITNSYTGRLLPLEFKATSTGGSALDITYHYSDPVNGGNSGHLWSFTNNLNNSRSEYFNYDQVNRILSAGTSATTGPYCWGYQYAYDTLPAVNAAWGNLSSQSGWSPNYSTCTQTGMAAVTADANNHISMFTYDASGNATGEPGIAYTWDAESQLISGAGLAYTYDGDGRRVSKGGTDLHWYGSGREVLAETNASGTTLYEYVYFGGKRIALLPAGSTAQYYVQDPLDSTRVLTTNTGVVCYDADFYPFGGESTITNTCTQNNYKFEGKERDTETGNDNFGARYYSNRFGRWLSADWSNVPVAVPYANLSNPQTLNLYSMVSDDPESFADLNGHCNATDWCGSLVGVAKGVNNLVNSAYGGIVATMKDPLSPVSAAEQFAHTGLKAYETKGVSGVLGDLAAQGRVDATAIVTEAVLTGGLTMATYSEPKEGTVTRYMGPGEAAAAEKSGFIPNVDVQGNPKAIHVTTDPPLDSAAAAKQKYTLPADPTHRATVPASQAGPLGPTPDGKPTADGGGTQAATQTPIPVKPKQIKKLNP